MAVPADIAARRAKLMGAPVAEPTDMGPAIEVMAQRINELQAQNALLQDSVTASNLALAGATAECAAQRERADGLQAQVAQEQAECAGLQQALAAAAQSQPGAPQIQIPAVDIAGIAAAVVASLPAQVVPTPTVPPKAWVLKTRDAAGNPREVRMTPEY